MPRTFLGLNVPAPVTHEISGARLTFHNGFAEDLSVFVSLTFGA